MTAINSPTFDTTYTQLPEHFYSFAEPTSVPQATPFALNLALANELGIDTAWLSSDAAAQALVGNTLLADSKPLAQAYAGHQFGSYNPQLGDGRAHLLGEIVAPNGERFDLQLKGSGPTPYSRRGDGRSPLGPVLREYLISEAMAALNVPTTRSLAAIATGQKILRKGAEPGAVLTRIAPSHIRIGTFEYFAMQGDRDAVKTLADYCLQRHFSHLADHQKPYLELLNQVIERQAKLIAQWQGFGFIHGVMNTDNMAISGETIDYGPCAFMDNYDPQTVFSSIDQFGRYSYSNQPSITKWNLARFAECLIPLIDPNKDKAIEIATEAINDFDKSYEIKWVNMMRDKLGLFGQDPKDLVLILDLLTWMHKNKADYTNTFCVLMNESVQNNKIYSDENFIIWKKRWEERLKLNNNTPEKFLKLMRSVNPLIIPRNHKVEEALEAADNNDLTLLKKLIKVLETPYEKQQENIDYQSPAPIRDKKYQTFCGT